MSAMSPTDIGPPSASPPPEPWVGKSRNAKAQARHRAKRKAYIEQLEQTVAKLQTALALSPEDVANLPTTQMKLRELKEENDSLRAEIRKLQYQPSASMASSYTIPTRAPAQLHSPASSEDHLREPKRRKLSPAAMDDYVSGSLQTYLTPADPVVDPVSVPNLGHAGSRQMLRISAPTPMLPPQVQYQRGIMTPQPSPADGPNVQQPQETMFTWPPFTSTQDEPNVSAASSSWPSTAQPNHQRQRSSSRSSSSSNSGPPYLTIHKPIQVPLAPSYKQASSSDHPGAYEPVPKAEDENPYEHAPEAYALPNGLPMSAFEPITPSEPSPWSDRAWPFAAGRMQ